jgi:hypothetical protein
MDESNFPDHRGMGINVRTDKQGNIRYADLIMDGLKTMESRKSNSLKSYVGKRVSIVRTGEGKAMAIGSVVVGKPVEVDEVGFRALQSSHLVPAGSTFDIAKGATKFLYPMLEPQRYEKELPVGHGIISRKVLF